MTRRHYLMIADVLRAYKGTEAQSVAVSLAVAFTQDNPRFNPATFITACGLPDDYDSSWIAQLRGKRPTTVT